MGSRRLARTHWPILVGGHLLQGCNAKHDQLLEDVEVDIDQLVDIEAAVEPALVLSELCQQSSSISILIQAVPVDVSVDALGKPVTNLTIEDFTVLEDGVPRPIHAFSSRESAYNILLLFDCSSSTQDQWPLLERAVSRFVRPLPAQHRVALAIFDDIVGRWIISLVVAAVQRALGAHRIDPTVLRFLGNTVSVALNVTLVVASWAISASRPRRSLL